jgi:hypothetical protein
MVHFQKVIIEGGGEYWNCRTVFDLISVLDLKFWGQMTGWLNFCFGEGNGDINRRLGYMISTNFLHEIIQIDP